MAYTRVGWKDKEDASFTEDSPSLCAENLNKMEDGIAASVCRSGDKMTGILKLHSDPTEADDAATKNYVDNNVLFITATYNTGTGDTRTSIVLGKVPGYTSKKYLPLVKIPEAHAEVVVPSSWVMMNGAIHLNPNTSYSYRVYVSIDESGTITVEAPGSTSGTIDFMFIPIKKTSLISG